MNRIARTVCLLVLSVCLGGASPSTPAPGPLRIIGNGSAGCIAGAVELPDEGMGFARIRQNSSAFWGAPSTIQRIEMLGERVRSAGLPDIYIGDISAARGGPLRGGHVSHQEGIDADVYLDVRPKPALSRSQREVIEPLSVVASDGREVDPAIWSPRHIALLKTAAGLPEVDRILVNPAIKKALCEQVTGDRSWLRLIRPWWGHSAHFHIRFRCPADQPLCQQAPPPPPGDSCDATLAWWFEPHAPLAGSGTPSAKPRLPETCVAIMNGPSG